MLPKVIIVGRPNAGKSTLFNRIIGRRHALMHETPYLTRDAIHEKMTWNGYEFEVIDTAGMDLNVKSKLNLSIISILKRYIEEADVVVFTVDGLSQLTLLDDQIAGILRKSRKHVILAVNKVDDKNVLKLNYEFNKFGFSDVHYVSAVHGTGVADLVDRITEIFKEKGIKKNAVLPSAHDESENAHGKRKRRPPEKAGKKSVKGGKAAAENHDYEDAEEFETFNASGISEEGARQMGKKLEESTGAAGTPLRIAIIGQPNAGKSSFLNSILGYDRTLVNDEPGTTRDSIDTEITFEGRKLTLVDTAGIRKNTTSYDKIEFFSVRRALKSVEKCDVAIIIIDITKGLTFQDKHILDMAFEKGRGVVIAFNKIDLVKKSQFDEAAGTIVNQIHNEFPDSGCVPKFFISTLKKESIFEPLNKAIEIFDYVTNLKITTSMVNSYMNEITNLHPPASFKGKMLKIYYSAMVSKTPPTLVLFVNNSNLIANSYRNYIVNKFRKAFTFEGYPVKVFIKKSVSKGREE